MFTSGIAKSTYIQEPPFFENFSMTARQHQAHHRRARARHFRRQRDDRPHFARRRVQEEFARRKISSSRTASPFMKISTATARVAATTAS